MPRNPLFCCGMCFFSHNPADEGFEYYECQYEAYRSVTDNTADQLPRVHKDVCVCPHWQHKDTFIPIAGYISETINQNEQS